MLSLGMTRLALALFLAGGLAAQQLPHAIPGGYDLPNGWRLTPLGRAIPTEDMVLNVSLAPDRKAVVALHSGYNPHGIVVVDTRSEEAVQRIPLKSTWLGLAWAPNGKRLYVSGGNANGEEPDARPYLHFRLRQRPSFGAARRNARGDDRHIASCTGRAWSTTGRSRCSSRPIAERERVRATWSCSIPRPANCCSASPSKSTLTPWC